MKKFEFRPRQVELDIAGNTYALDVDTNLGAKLQTHGKELVGSAAKIQAGACHETDGVQLCVKIIDDLLSEGQTAAIFGERPVTLDDCADILYYIMDEVEAFRKAGENRAQRRQRQHQGIQGAQL